MSYQPKVYTQEQLTSMENDLKFWQRKADKLDSEFYRNKVSGMEKKVHLYRLSLQNQTRRNEEKSEK